MQLSLQNFNTLVGTMSAAAVGASKTLLDLTVGSVLRAILESSASVALWIQYLILQVLTMTRLSTSVGVDADSWVADFGMTRLSAVPAVGVVTMTSFNPSVQASTIANGMTVKTSDGLQVFTVVGGPYIRSVGAASVVVSVEAAASGTSGNVQAGMVTMLGSAVPGIDTVTNENAFSGGSDEESDIALRTRFVNYINTRAQATEQAIGYAISAIQQNISYTILENMTAAGVYCPGNIHVVVDDGSGAPPTTLLASVAASLDLVRPIGTTVTVNGPNVLQAVVDVVLETGADADIAVVETLVVSSLATYIGQLGVGKILRYSRLAGLCFDASSDIVNVRNITLNGAANDLGGQSNTVVRYGPSSIIVVPE